MTRSAPWKWRSRGSGLTEPGSFHASDRGGAVPSSQQDDGARCERDARAGTGGHADLALRTRSFCRGPRGQAGLYEHASQLDGASIPAARRRLCVPELLSRRHVGDGALEGVRIEILAKGGIAVRTAGHGVRHLVTRPERADRLRRRRGRCAAEGLGEEAALADEHAEGGVVPALPVALDAEDVSQAGSGDARRRRSLRRRRSRERQEGGKRRREQKWTSHGRSLVVLSCYTVRAERVPPATLANAASRSTTRSSADSRPTESRMRFRGAANGPSAVEACVIRAGSSMRLSTPPRDSASLKIFVLATSAVASSSDSARNEIMPPKSRICFAAIVWPGCRGSPGYRTCSTRGW